MKICVIVNCYNDNNTIEKNMVNANILNKIKNSKNVHFLFVNTCYSEEKRFDKYKIPDRFSTEFNNSPLTCYRDETGCIPLNKTIDNLVFFKENISEIEVCGFDLDAEVLTNAIIAKAGHPNVKISVDVNCSYTSSFEGQQAAVKVLTSNKINVIY